MSTAPRRASLRALPRPVLMLGAVSFLADVAGEMLQPLIPLYLVAIGASAVAVGAVEGAAEAAVSLVKVVSGRVSDRLPRRKPLVLAGYGLAAVAKPALALAVTWPAVLLLRSLDRVGKGLRGAPRDAMVGDLAPEGRRGLAFGFHRSADTAGAVLGPLVALALLAAWGQGPGAMRLVFLASAVPMALCVALLAAGVREPAVPREPRPLRRGALPPGFLAFLAVAALLGVAPVALAFMLLRAQSLGADLLGTVGLYVGFNAIYALMGLPLGLLSDRRGPGPVLTGGLLVAALVFAGLAAAPAGLAGLAPLFLAYGVAMAASETASRALVVDLAPAEARGTALGAFHAVVGLAALPLGLALGVTWEEAGPAAAFLLASALAAAGAVLLLAFLQWRGRAPPEGRQG